MVGVRTPQGFGGCAPHRRLRKRSNQKERPLYSQLRQIEAAFLTAYTRWITTPHQSYNARITRPLSNAHYGKIYCARYVFLKIGRNTIRVLYGNGSYIACFALLRRCHPVSNYSTSENGSAATYIGKRHFTIRFSDAFAPLERGKKLCDRYDETHRQVRFLKFDTLIVFYSIRSERCRRSVSSKVSRRPAPSLSARPNFCHPVTMTPLSLKP